MSERLSYTFKNFMLVLLICTHLTHPILQPPAKWRIEGGIMGIGSRVRYNMSNKKTTKKRFFLFVFKPKWAKTAALKGFFCFVSKPKWAKQLLWKVESKSSRLFRDNGSVFNTPTAKKFLVFSYKYVEISRSVILRPPYPKKAFLNNPETPFLFFIELGLGVDR